MSKDFDDMNLNEMLMALDRFYDIQEQLKKRTIYIDEKIKYIENSIFIKTAYMRNKAKKQR